MRLFVSLIVLLGLPALFLTPGSQQEDRAEPQLKAAPSDVANYCNTRFGFCVNYSANLLPVQQAAENGDGAVLKTEDGSGVVKVNGAHNVFNWTPEELYAFNLEHTLPGDPADVVVVSQKMDKNRYEAHLLSGGKSLYHRGFIVNGNYVLLVIETPADRPVLLEDLRRDVSIGFDKFG